MYPNHNHFPITFSLKLHPHNLPFFQPHVLFFSLCNSPPNLTIAAPVYGCRLLGEKVTIGLTLNGAILSYQTGCVH